MNDPTLDMPEVGEYLFIISGHGRPKYVTGRVTEVAGTAAVVCIFHATPTRFCSYEAGTLYSFVPSECKWRVIEPHFPVGGWTDNMLYHSKGAVSEALEVLNRATQLANDAGDNIGVFINIADWRTAINLLKEIP